MHDEVERILNEGLATYTAVDPPTNMLGELQLARSACCRSFSSARWIVPVAALAAVATLTAFFLIPSEPARLTVAAIRTVPSPPIAKRAPPPPHKQVRTAAGKPTPVPLTSAKRDQFPSPVPLTREESALLAVARTHPEQLARLAAELKPIEIQEIQIAPLEAGGDQETKPQ